MDSGESSSGLEDAHRNDGDGVVLPDAPLPSVEPVRDTEQEAEESSSDGLGFLNEPLPPQPLNSSDDDLYEPDSPDEDEGLEDQNDLVKPEEDEDDVIFHRTPSPWAPPKRRADESGLDARPYKKAKGTAFNHGYLSLLNTDIEDAAAQYAPHDRQHLPASQIGMTGWNSVEKELFFEALSRLGKDDIQGIARRIRTKGQLEVRQYIQLLQDVTSREKKERKLVHLCLEDVPAAIEISPQCSAALEEAADAIATRQETHEKSLERKQWGDNWLITPFNYRKMEAESSGDMPALELFRVSSWLRLPERVFMNANFPENNWQFVSEENPSIRATALDDFYSLAVSVTKRLVAATIYVAQSRIHAKKNVHYKHEAHNLVWVKDVEAAALSIGLKTDSGKFWAGCARRLRLDVYDYDGQENEDDNAAGAESGANSDAEDEPMTYDEVEAALGGANAREASARPADDSEDEELVSLSDTPSLDELSDLDDQPSPAQLPYEPTSAQVPVEDDEPELDINEEAVRTETKELLLYTAQDNPPTTRTRQAAEYRIRRELQHVAYADALDARASQREERRLWQMLGRDPPEEFMKVKVPDHAPHRSLHGVDDMYPSTGDWRNSVKYVSDWERLLHDSKDVR